MILNLRLEIWCAVLVSLLSACSAWAAAAGRLRVTANHRYLEYENGKPFFYLGDTAWSLFYRLDRDEATRYLTDRAGKGFTVIQATALTSQDGPPTPNPYGALPLIDRDPARPNDAFFRHVDFIVNKAEELGLFIGMLPTWGNNWAMARSILNTTNARHYGRFLGSRYKDKPIIWILGGDRTVRNDEERAILDAMAAGLTEGDGGAHLKTFHPGGPGRSSLQLHDATWLDFNMSQTSHASHDHDNGLFAEHDYALKPPKPTLDGEPRYEQIQVGFYFQGNSRLDRFDDYDVRQAAYWSLLAGACGHTYGNNNVFQMYKLPPKEAGQAAGNPGQAGGGDRGQSRGVFGANVPWYEALDHPGAFQMSYVRRLFESLPFTKLVPDQSLILNGPTAGGAKIRAARSTDGSFAIVYSPRGESFAIDKGIIKGEQVRQFWYDPRYGVSYVFQETVHFGFQTYTPPTSGRGQDWILVLQDVAAGLAVPGPSQ